MQKQKPVAVVGLGRSGLAAVQFLTQHGTMPVLACDERTDLDVSLESLENLEKSFKSSDVTWVLGGIPGDQLACSEKILLSPGVPRDHPALAQAFAASVPVINDVEWLYRWVNDVDNAGNAGLPFIGITGTNGKSTVTTLVGEMLRESGWNVAVGGNLGTPALSLCLPGYLDLVDLDGFVLELSSFQLESLQQFRPHIGVMLNLTPDHMDRYSSREAYFSAKWRLFSNQQPSDCQIINDDDPNIDQEVVKRNSARIVGFSIENPVKGGLYATEGVLMDCRDGKLKSLMPVDRIRMVGRHNRANAVAAAATALEAGASPEAVVKVLERFPGLAHRLEWVRTLEGVRYYNDSKGTNVGAMLQSIRSFRGGVVLIAGGRDKRGDFEILKPWIDDRVEAMVLMGESAEMLSGIFSESKASKTIPILSVETMSQAVQVARSVAPRDGVVLLSPGCASFDMFRGFEDRGERFREAVHAL